ncbi:response regulator [bacterium]|nr:response regulator [bacterium]
MKKKPSRRANKTVSRKLKTKTSRTSEPSAPAWENAAEHFSDAVIILDAKGRCVFVNQAFCSMFIIEAEKAAGLKAPELSARIKAMFKDGKAFDETLAGKNKTDVKLEFLNPHIRYVRLRVIPLAKQTLLEFRDLTESMQFERSVSEAYRDIEKKKYEFEQRNQELEKAYRQIDEVKKGVMEANRLKSEFLSNMSHELRTPLNSILALSSILLARMDGELTEEQDKQIKIIEKSGKNLLRLINDILDISKIEAGRMDLICSEYEMDAFLSGIEMTIRPMLREAGLEFTIEKEPDIDVHSTDENKLKQILLNLLSNAIKFTPKGSIVLKVGRTKFHDVLEFAVIDTGIGIDNSNFDTIFDPFRQIDGSTTRKYGGTGLGLAITKKLVELLGGRIWVESEIGHGSEFHFILPAQRRGAAQPSEKDIEAMVSEARHLHAEAEPAEEPFTPDPQKKKILVVEDDEEAVYIFKKYLEGDAFQVLVAKDGETGMQKAEQFQPDVITLDIMMPRKDGWEVLQALKKNSVTKNIPVAIVSMLDNRKLGFSLGASDYIVKPISQDMFLKRLHKLSEERGLKKILIVDDDLSQAELVEEILESDDFVSEVATSGEMAIQLARKKSYDLVILDLLMPQTDGFAVLKSLQNDNTTDKTPVLVLTGKLLTQEDQQRLTGERYHVFQKTMFSREKLLEEIHRILQNGNGA